MGTFQHPTSGEVLVIDDITVASSAARTATGQTAGVAVGDKGVLRLLLDVTAVSGTPTLDVTIQTSFDNGVSDAWRSINSSATFAQKTAVASERKSFGGCDRYVRASYVIGGGTPSLTFSIIGEAV